MQTWMRSACLAQLGVAKPTLPDSIREQDAVPLSRCGEEGPDEIASSI
jgi:hypothetical protein